MNATIEPEEGREQLLSDAESEDLAALESLLGRGPARRSRGGAEESGGGAAPPTARSRSSR